jgi:hypothetical protein
LPKGVGDGGVPPSYTRERVGGRQPRSAGDQESGPGAPGGVALPRLLLGYGPAEFTGLGYEAPCHDEPCLFSGLMSGSQPVPEDTR